MTLIVSKIFENRIFIESDTKITDRYDGCFSPLLGVLKTVIINPYVAISFAGNIDLAEEALYKIIGNNLDFDQIINILISSNKKSIDCNFGDENSEVDFIVSILEFKIPMIDLVPRIFKIAKGKIETGENSAWIGNKDAFSIFQRNFLTFKSEGITQINALREAFKVVISDESVETVGNFQISVIDDPEISGFGKVFRYAMKTEVDIGPQTIKLESNTPIAMKLGTAGNGSYEVSYLVSVSPVVFGVGLHFFHGNYGVVFCPQISKEGVVFRNVNGKDFVKKVSHLPFFSRQNLAQA